CACVAPGSDVVKHNLIYGHFSAARNRNSRTPYLNSSSLNCKSRGSGWLKVTARRLAGIAKSGSQIPGPRQPPVTQVRCDTALADARIVDLRLNLFSSPTVRGQGL